MKRPTHEHEKLVLELAGALHRFGVPAHRLESTLSAVAAMFAIEAQFLSLPTAVLAFFGPLGEQRAGALRLQPGEVDLGKLVRLDETLQATISGSLTPEESLATVRRIVHEPPRYGRALTCAAFTLASGCAAHLFGGGVREAAVSALVGVVLWSLQTLLHGRASDLIVPVCAFVAALLSALGTSILPFARDVVTMSSLLVFLPGLTLTVAATELATKNFASGSARLTVAFLIFFQLVFGVALGGTVGNLLVGGASHTPTPLGWWADIAAVAGVSASFVVLLKARWQDTGWLLLAAAVAVGAARVGSATLGGGLGAWIGAVAIGIVANTYSRWRNRPASVMMVPGILLLVPGSLGLRSLTWLMQEQTHEGTTAIFETMLIAIALALGSLAANVVVQPRRDL